MCFVRCWRLSFSFMHRLPSLTYLMQVQNTAGGPGSRWQERARRVAVVCLALVAGVVLIAGVLGPDVNVQSASSRSSVLAAELGKSSAQAAAHTTSNACCATQCNSSGRGAPAFANGARGSKAMHPVPVRRAPSAPGSLPPGNAAQVQKAEAEASLKTMIARRKKEEAEAAIALQKLRRLEADVAKAETQRKLAEARAAKAVQKRKAQEALAAKAEKAAANRKVRKIKCL